MAQWSWIRDCIVAGGAFLLAALALTSVLAGEFRKLSVRGVVVFFLGAVIATGVAQKGTPPDGDGLLMLMPASSFPPDESASDQEDLPPVYTNPVRFVSFDYSPTNLSGSVTWDWDWAPDARYHFVTLYGTCSLSSNCWVEIGRLRISEWGVATNFSFVIDWPTVFSNAVSSGAFPSDATPDAGFVCAFPDLDTDGDGLPDGDEILIYGTSWDLCDSDGDGLDDPDELFDVFSDPNDAFSLSGVCNDGFAYRLDGFSPFEEVGGGYTALEALFYTGSVYGSVGGLPESTSAAAVLEVSSAGSGAADLIVNGTVVPLVPGAPPLLVSLPRGVVLSVELRGDPNARAQLDSSDFCVGEWSDSSGPGVGWIAFPFVEPTRPCIHDSYERTVEVTLDPGVDGVSCTWQAGTVPRMLAAGPASGSGTGYGSDSVTVVNHPPLSATITARFPRDGSCAVTYTLHHDRYLFGTTTYQQTCEFCPKVEVECELDGLGGFYESTQDYPDDPTKDPERESDDRYRYCPVHQCLYVYCEGRHELDPGEYDEFDPSPGYVESSSNAYFAAFYNPSRFTDVLKLHRPFRADDARYLQVEVPPDGDHCCGCPDHWEGFVSVLFKSHRLSLRRGGETSAFTRTTDDCTLAVRGVSPSADFEDASLVLCKSGEAYQAHDYTVLGVSILAEDDDNVLASLNEKDATFGFPVIAGTNLDSAACLRFRTDVNLPTGYVRLALESAETRMQLWMWTYSSETAPGRFVKVVDSETRPSVCMSITDWKAYVRRATICRETPMRIVAFGKGKGRIVFGYAGGSGGRYLSDEVSQTITAVPVPLLPDYNRDGVIDDDDEAFATDGATFRYWTNEDCDKGDYVGQYTDVRPNVEPDALLANVKGKLDLVNLFPVRVDVRQIARALGNDAEIEVIAGSGKLRYCVLDLPTSQAGKIYRDDVSTLDDEPLESASLSEFPDVETSLHDLGCDNTGSVQRLLAMEAIDTVDDYGSPVLAVRLHGRLVMNYRMKCSIGSVRDMYRFYSLRGAEESGSDFVLPVHLSNPGLPDEKDLDIFFTHGFNVSEPDAHKWGDSMFKRFWLSGSNARFNMVTWTGNYHWTGDWANGLHYQQDVYQALMTGNALKRLVEREQPDSSKRILMTQSLGNMVACEALRQGLHVGKYFMFDAAVPTEAIDAVLQDDSETTRSKYVPSDWLDYDPLSWSANWFRWFADDQDDARGRIGWPGRFTSALGNANEVYNFYSTGDEVFHETAFPPALLEGMTESAANYCWQKQETFKGSALPAGTAYGGWGFAMFASNRFFVYDPSDGKIHVHVTCQRPWVTDSYFVRNPADGSLSQIAESELKRLYGVTDDELLIARTQFVPHLVPISTNDVSSLVADGSITNNPVFNREFTPMFDRNASQSDQFLALAKYVPAVSSPVGGNPVLPTQRNNIDMNDPNNGIPRPNGWGRSSDEDVAPWKHSDMKDLAYFYVYKLYENLLTKGDLK